MTTLPTASELDMWPYVDADSPLWNLEHAADIAEELPDETDCYDQGIAYHEIMGYLFSMADAHEAMIREGILTSAHASHVRRQLQRMRYGPSPLFRGLESLVAYEDYETALDVYNHLVGTEGE